MSSETHGKVCYLILPSLDPAKSGEFYESVFGWSLRTHGDGTQAFDDSTGQVSGMWVTGQPPASDARLQVHIMVDNLEQAIEAIRQAGGRVDPADMHLDAEKWALFTDPDGNRLGIYEHGSG